MNLGKRRSVDDDMCVDDETSNTLFQISEHFVFYPPPPDRSSRTVAVTATKAIQQM